MKNLQASRPDIDVVGTYHPYCAIRGLRSCWNAQSTNFDAPDGSRGLLRAAGRRLPFVARFFNVDFDDVAVMHYARENSAYHAFQTPFWKDGGTLYVHYLLPHPTILPEWGNHIHDLAKNYKENIGKAAQFIESVDSRLKARFGLDYALIVTTDHSLRTHWWCGRLFFHTDHCAKDNPPDTTKIPFLVLAPDTVKVTLPATNVGIFTPLPEGG